MPRIAASKFACVYMIRTWTADPRIPQLGGLVSPRPRIYIYIYIYMAWAGERIGSQHRVAASGCSMGLQHRVAASGPRAASRCSLSCTEQPPPETRDCSLGCVGLQRGEERRRGLTGCFLARCTRAASCGARPPPPTGMSS